MGVFDFLNRKPNIMAGTNQGLERGDGAFGSYAGNTNRLAGETRGIGSIPNRSNTILGMKPDQFSQFFGALGHAIAPDTPMGRVGKTVSGLATKRIDFARGEKDKELSRSLTRLKIQSEEKSLAKQPALTELGLFRKSPEEFGKFKAAGRAAPTKSTFEKEFMFAKEQGYRGTPEDWKSITKTGQSDTSLIKNHNKAVEQGYKGTLVDFKRVGVEKPPKSAAEKRMDRYGDISKKMAALDKIMQGAYEPGERATHKKKIETEYDAAIGGWQAKFDKEGNKVYITPQGDVKNEAGEKIGEIDKLERIPSTLGKSHTDSLKTISFRKN